jgi:hypothetical protein
MHKLFIYNQLRFLTDLDINPIPEDFLPRWQGQTKPLNQRVVKKAEKRPLGEPGICIIGFLPAALTAVPRFHRA